MIIYYEKKLKLLNQKEMGSSESKIREKENDESGQIIYLDQIKLFTSPKNIRKLSLVQKDPEF